MGNYLFVNSLENGVYKLACAKLVNAWNNKNISLEYFRFLDKFNFPLEEKIFNDLIEKMIADENNPLISIDSTDDLHFILDDVSSNHFQSLLNKAKSQKVIRLK